MSRIYFTEHGVVFASRFDFARGERYAPDLETLRARSRCSEAA